MNNIFNMGISSLRLEIFLFMVTQASEFNCYQEMTGDVKLNCKQIDMVLNINFFESSQNVDIWGQMKLLSFWGRGSDAVVLVSYFSDDSVMIYKRLF